MSKKSWMLIVTRKVELSWIWRRNLAVRRT